MKEQILKNIDSPMQLEMLYRDNKSNFKREFNQLYPEIRNHTPAQFWYERLNFSREEIINYSGKDLLFVIIASFLAGLTAKIPDIFSIPHDYFYPRNIAFIVFPFLAVFFAWKHKVNITQRIIVLAVFLISAIYINILPDNTNSDTFILACLHLPLLLWATLGYTFIGSKIKDFRIRLDFLRFNGDLLVMAAMIVIAGAIFTGITFGLFSLIEVYIEEFFQNYIAIWGAATVPILATYLVRTNPMLVNKVSPVIAKIFTPVVLVTLAIYLAAVIYTGKDPYNDREFLMIFNLLLIGVMAIILFSVAESSKSSKQKAGSIMLLLLSVLTIIINGIALSAIVFRINEWGITPNRLAVLGSNLLILANLLVVAYNLFKSTKSDGDVENVGKSIAMFLPVYTIWTIIVTFVFPFLFNFD